MKKKIATFTIVYFICLIPLFSQSNISGSIESMTNFFMRDSTIGATGTPQYDNLLTGTDTWFNLNYNNYDWGFMAGIRLDVFLNSNLHDPLQAFTGIGIGRWFIRKELKDLQITAGHFYDQIGSGIIFRAYEERPLAIDNALLGVNLKYDLTDHIFIKAFAGQQKNIFDTYAPIIKGVNIEGFHSFGEDLSIVPGAGLVNRTLDQANMDIIVSNIESYPNEQRFVPKYNTYAYTFYNRVNYKDLSWYAEYSGKTAEAIENENGTLVNDPGSVFYTNLTYTRSSKGRGIGVTGAFKRTENFVFRTSPNQTLTDGLIGFLPPLTRLNTYRLLARYNAATQYLGEMAYQLDVITTPVKGISFTFNFANINDLSNELLFREFYGDVYYKKKKNWNARVGAQYLIYNQPVYETKGTEPLTAINPFLEFVYKIDRRKSIKAEVQYQHNEHDYGSWIYGLIEFSIAPKFSFAISDMYNVKPLQTAEDLHYYSIFASYTKNANRFSLSYVKQVEGVVCTGGICRYEPAFSGFRFSVNSTF